MRTPKPHNATDGTITYKVQFREPRGRAGKTTSETFDTKKQALRFAALIEHMTATEAIAQMDLENGTAEVVTLDKVAAEHIRYLTGIEDGTRLNYERLWARTWGPLLGPLPANQITKDRVSDATNQLAKHYAAKSLKNQRGLLAAVCDRAVDQGHLKTNPTKRLRLPRGQEAERVEMRILTDAELSRIIANTHPHYQALMQFLASTGCRWGEAVALTVGDVDLNTGQVRIRRALKWSPDNKRTVGATKTTRSNRSLPLPDQMRDVLRPLLGKDRDALVFTAPRGGPAQHRTFWSDVWFPAIEAADLGEPRPRIHDLRHSYAGRLLGAGVPIHIVQRLLGHESIKTTVDTYGGLMPDALSQAVTAGALAFVPISQTDETGLSEGTRLHYILR